MWDEADFEKWTDHCRYVASLVVTQCTPLGNHECVHGNPHIPITERERERVESELCNNNNNNNKQQQQQYSVPVEDAVPLDLAQLFQLKGLLHREGHGQGEEVLPQLGKR